MTYRPGGFVSCASHCDNNLISQTEIYCETSGLLGRSCCFCRELAPIRPNVLDALKRNWKGCSHGVSGPAAVALIRLRRLRAASPLANPRFVVPRAGWLYLGRDPADDERHTRLTRPIVDLMARHAIKNKR
jgi:hypothetical protein